MKEGRIRSVYPIPGADLGAKIGNFVGVPFVGGVIDFFNPLSDIQVVVNEFSEQSCN